MFDQKYTISDISLEGFQVVSGHYFTRCNEPAMTLWQTAISFNVASFTALNNCDAVQILVNDKKHYIVVKPVLSKEKDALNWKKKSPKSSHNRIECAAFGRRLYEQWNFDPGSRYRANGKLVQCDSKVMLLYDFTHPESWKGTKSVK